MWWFRGGANERIPFDRGPVQDAKWNFVEMVSNATDPGRREGDNFGRLEPACGAYSVAGLWQNTGWVRNHFWW